jgi:hypothetical protein
LAEDYLAFHVGWLSVDGPGASGFSIDISSTSFFIGPGIGPGLSGFPILDGYLLMVITGPGFSGFSFVTYLLHHSSFKLAQDYLAFQVGWLSVNAH